MRDWSSFGSCERKQCYGPIIEEIDKNYPETEFRRSEINVLVPGAGLGRLAFEIASRGLYIIYINKLMCDNKCYFFRIFMPRQ